MIMINQQELAIFRHMRSMCQLQICTTTRQSIFREPPPRQRRCMYIISLLVQNFQDDLKFVSLSTMFTMYNVHYTVHCTQIKCTQCTPVLYQQWVERLQSKGCSGSIKAACASPDGTTHALKIKVK